MSNKIKIALIMAISGIVVAIISSSNTSNKPLSKEGNQTNYGEKSQNIQSKGNVNTNFY